jgi:hypothetical protein
MKFRRGISVASGLALVLAGASAAFAKGATGPSGNLNVRIDGYEVLTPSAGSPGQYTINGLGQVIGDSNGELDGVLTYTLVNVASATEQTCSDSVSGSTITAPTGGFSESGGSFTASLVLTAGSGATADCESATIALLCNRTLSHHNLVDDLDAGTYHCIATGVTAATGGTTAIDAASLTVRIGTVDGANAPTD